VTFNDPYHPREISNQLKHLIKSADDGSVIQVAIYQFKDGSIASALIRAHQRGVAVQVLGDGDTDSRYPRVWGKLSAELGNDTSKSSWAATCDDINNESHKVESKGKSKHDNDACLGGSNVPSGGTTKPIMHNKVALFSGIGGERVVFESSANFKAGGSGDGNWNNSVTFIGNRALYDTESVYFNELARGDRSETDYRGDGLLPPNDKRIDSFHSPRAAVRSATAGPGATTDPVVRELHNVGCSQSAAGPTSVRVAMALFTRDEIAQQLVAMDKAGCDVEVILRGKTRTRSPVGAAVKRTLTNSGVEVWQFPPDEHFNLHSKYLAVNDLNDRDSDRKFVLTGSHNYTNPALRYNDETLLRIEDDDVYDEYATNFEELKGSALTQSKHAPWSGADPGSVYRAPKSLTPAVTMRQPDGAARAPPWLGGLSRYGGGRPVRFDWVGARGAQH